MSHSPSVTLDSTPSHLQAHSFPQSGELNGRQIVKADLQISKKWLIVALVVGSLFVIVGAVGLYGLLNSQNLISLPQSFGIIGQLPQWSLWTMTAGGFTLGSCVIGYGIFQFLRLKRIASQLEIFTNCFAQKKVRKFFRILGRESFAIYGLTMLGESGDHRNLSVVVKTSNETLFCTPPLELTQLQEISDLLATKLNYQSVQFHPLLEVFGDHFTSEEIKSLFQSIPNSKYTIFSNQEGEPSSNKLSKDFIIALKTSGGRLLCTPLINQNQTEQIATHLETNLNYTLDDELGPMLSLFGEKFPGDSQKVFQILDSSTYYAASDENFESWMVFMKTAYGKLFCTPKITPERADTLRRFLKERLGIRSFRSEFEQLAKWAQESLSPIKALAANYSKRKD